MADSDLNTASFSLNAEADILRRLISQAAGGDIDARSTLLPAELESAKNLRAFYEQNLTGAVDAAAIDAAIAAAETYLRGPTVTGGLPPVVSNAGLRLGTTVFPWSSVLVFAAVVGGGLYFATRPKRRNS